MSKTLFQELTEMFSKMNDEAWTTPTPEPVRKTRWFRWLRRGAISDNQDS